MNLTTSMWPGDGTPGHRVATYSEALNMGYRWYHAHGVTPAFAFGHGLSYTQFALGGLTVSGSTVSFSVRNTGAVAGSAVAQLYLTFPSSAGEPPKQLKRFEKARALPCSHPQHHATRPTPSLSFCGGAAQLPASSHTWPVCHSIAQLLHSIAQLLQRAARLQASIPHVTVCVAGGGGTG